MPQPERRARRGSASSAISASPGLSSQLPSPLNNQPQRYQWDHCQPQELQHLLSSQRGSQNVQLCLLRLPFRLLHHPFRHQWPKKSPTMVRTKSTMIKSTTTMAMMRTTTTGVTPTAATTTMVKTITATITVGTIMETGDTSAPTT